VPVVDVVGDDVATGVIVLGIEVRDQIEVEHALIVSMHERETVVVSLDIKSRHKLKSFLFETPVGKQR